MCRRIFPICFRKLYGLFVCLSASKYHEDERFGTSGFSPVHFRLLEPITQDTLLNLKDGGQGEVKIYLK